MKESNPLKEANRQARESHPLLMKRLKKKVKNVNMG